MRVLSYNVRHCQGVGSLISVRRTARTIAALSPDVVAANELYRWPGCYDQPALLARLLGMHVVFQANVVVGALEYGNAILSREPVRVLADVQLPHRWERRGLLLAETRADGTELTVGVTHLSLNRQTRALQVAVCAEAIAELGNRPMVLCGDLNADVRELGALRGVLASTDEPPPTYHALMPRVAYDHVLWSAHFRADTVGTARTLASDHLPVFADLVVCED